MGARLRAGVIRCTFGLNPDPQTLCLNVQSQRVVPQKGATVIKAAFFDIDGTLLSFTTHTLSDSTKAALISLRANGIKCFIASGRAKYQFPPAVADGFEGFDGFDGFVSLTGSVCYDAGGIYYDVPIPRADVVTIAHQVKEGRYVALVMEANDSFVTAHTPGVRAIERKADIVYQEGSIDKILRPNARVYQFCAYLPPEREHEITDVCPDVFTTRWNDIFCDVVPKASSKPEGIRKTLEHVGLTADEAIAFGDGGNDETMLKYCGIGVAMGNAVDGAKAVADYVTDDTDHDGIYNACRHFGLI